MFYLYVLRIAYLKLFSNKFNTNCTFLEVCSSSKSAYIDNYTRYTRLFHSGDIVLIKGLIKIFNLYDRQNYLQVCYDKNTQNNTLYRKYTFNAKKLKNIYLLYNIWNKICQFIQNVMKHIYLHPTFRYPTYIQ